MPAFIDVLKAAACWIVAGCTFHYLWTFLYHPETFARMHAPHRGIQLPLYAAYMILVLIGAGACIYSGLVIPFRCLPTSWVTREVQSITAGVLTFYLTLITVSRSTEIVVGGGSDGKR